MSRLKKVILGVAIVTGALGAVMFGGGALMDGSIQVGVEKRLSASPQVLFTFLDNTEGLDAWWSVGQEGQPDDVPRMKVKRKSGPDAGAGLEVIFVAAGEGEGSVMETWRIKSVTPPSNIVYEVDFAGALTVERTLTLTPDGDGTRVSWQEKGTIDRPAMRWMKVFMPPEKIQDNFDRALAALDRAAKTRRAG
jgi:hypothetical protein